MQMQTECDEYQVSLQIRKRFIYIGRRIVTHMLHISWTRWTLIKTLKPSFKCRKPPQCSKQRMNLMILAARLIPVGFLPPSGISRSINTFAFNYKIKKGWREHNDYSCSVKCFPAFAMKTQISPCGNTFHLYCKPSDWQKSAFLRKTGWVIWVESSKPVVPWTIH